jgi:hypothetical protein
MNVCTELPNTGTLRVLPSQEAMPQTLVRGVKYVLIRICSLRRRHINRTVTILGIVHRPVSYLKLNPVGLSVAPRNPITSLLRAQQVNGICRFVCVTYFVPRRVKLFARTL